MRVLHRSPPKNNSARPNPVLPRPRNTKAYRRIPNTKLCNSLCAEPGQGWHEQKLDSRSLYADSRGHSISYASPQTAPEMNHHTVHVLVACGCNVLFGESGFGRRLQGSRSSKPFVLVRNGIKRSSALSVCTCIRIQGLKDDRVLCSGVDFRQSVPVCTFGAYGAYSHHVQLARF